jgi:hypothetical protein
MTAVRGVIKVDRDKPLVTLLKGYKGAKNFLKIAQKRFDTVIFTG